MPNHTIQEPLLAHINQWFIYENLYGRYQFTVSNKKIQNTTSPLMEYSISCFVFLFFGHHFLFRKRVLILIIVTHSQVYISYGFIGLKLWGHVWQKQNEVKNKKKERERESRRRIEFNIFLIRNAYGFAWHSPSDERASNRGGDFWKSSVGSLLPRVGQFEVNPGPSQFSLRRSLSSLSVIASIIP